MVWGWETDGWNRHLLTGYLTIKAGVSSFCMRKEEERHMSSTKNAKRVKPSTPSKILTTDSKQTETLKTSKTTGWSKLIYFINAEYIIEMPGWMSAIQHNMSPTKHVPQELNKDVESLPKKTKKQLKKQEQKQREKARPEKTMQKTEVSDERPLTFRNDLCEESQLECINCRGGDKRLTRCRGCW